MKKIYTLIALFIFFQTIMKAQNAVKILSYEIDTAANHNCYDWNYPNRDTLQILITKMFPISEEEHHGGFSNYSCDISGYLIYNRRRYYYEFNAGGFVMLIKHHDIYYLACKNKEYFKYFLATEDVGNE